MPPPPRPLRVPSLMAFFVSWYLQQTAFFWYQVFKKKKIKWFHLIEVFLGIQIEHRRTG